MCVVETCQWSLYNTITLIKPNRIFWGFTQFQASCIYNIIYNDVTVKHKKIFIMFVIVLWQHVSILIESSSGPSKKIDPYLAMFKMRCGIPNAYIS